ncbi:division/cell wall cluster transcriptional repressor MraZ [Pseudoflavonifractor sp. 524-17]|uniref:division/cell wall cluster transcriptional repressor MraZ n=1 Tax=Pseudoflavonifractor sp. 524-17 TaxID=2304577 RepID=UPI001379B8C0|nr:division/cell wall cluster transcriptional repressor MraZ [Pseudoflavonifractor sp. 524-17]NCE63350.1 division/cell wall cluster transcriptional repressor MraZ [Pseudoflavonifractor sp. 524-17]
MTGTYEHTIDAKGRMFLPSKLREELGQVFHVAVGANRDSAGVCRYLVMYPQAAWEKLQARVAELPSSQAAAMDVIFGNAARCEPDSQYRIMLPQDLRDYAGLTKDVVVVGNNDKAKIWDAQTWNEKKKRELTPEQVADTMLLLGL